MFEDTVEAFVPRVDGEPAHWRASFIKGCYTGQEVVARMPVPPESSNAGCTSHISPDTQRLPLAQRCFHRAANRPGRRPYRR